MEVEELDVAAAAARYGISERTICRHLQLLSAPVWIQAAVVKGEEVELADGSKEVRKLDLTGAVELQRTFNSYCRLEEAAAGTSSKAVRDQNDRERAAVEARGRAKAQCKAEAVKARALRENWSRRRWQDFAAAVAKQGPAPIRSGIKIPRPPGCLFDSREDRLIVNVRCIAGGPVAELRRLARCLSELLERVEREADRGEVRERQCAAVAGDSAAGQGGAQVHGCGHE
ncbi:MAG: hypothetical protein A2V77_15265 [Anaeromyxobacter sp. RBG_16_69_14]|nr:MAG: hypothetical protein A2V77_15265 [Anaeromyxobacter sp. RBG_16_69_14]